MYSNLRWCLWISDDDREAAEKISDIKQRISKVYEFRIASKAKTTNQYSIVPHKFAQRSYVPGDVIFVPSVSSERRQYVPFGYLDSNSIISNLAYAIYKSEPYLFAIICSHMHMTWVRTVAGRLESRIRYTAAVCYNPFPFPGVSTKEKQELEHHAFRVLEEREAHSEQTMAQLYDPDIMPNELREAHHDLDVAVERCYRSKPFKDDEERLRFLFDRYEQLIEAEKRS